MLVFEVKNKYVQSEIKMQAKQDGCLQCEGGSCGGFLGRFGFKYYLYFICLIVISEGYFKHPMEGQNRKLEEKVSKSARKKAKMDEENLQDQQKKLILVGHASGADSDGSKESLGWSSEIIQPAIKTMSFRPKRGTRMKELIKGKYKKDQFWDKYQNYFGGNLNQPDDSDDQEDYQASSSGRDQFDSDFDLTDSYVGKRGRKKGTKVKRRKKPIAKVDQDKEDVIQPPKGKRGRKKKVVLPSKSQENNYQQLKIEGMIEQENQKMDENIQSNENGQSRNANLVEGSPQKAINRLNSKKKSGNNLDHKAISLEQGIYSEIIEKIIFK